MINKKNITEIVLTVQEIKQILADYLSNILNVPISPEELKEVYDCEEEDRYANLESIIYRKEETTTMDEKNGKGRKKN